jgi:hypothetical protein
LKTLFDFVGRVILRGIDEEEVTHLWTALGDTVKENSIMFSTEANSQKFGAEICICTWLQELRQLGKPGFKLVTLVNSVTAVSEEYDCKLFDSSLLSDDIFDRLKDNCEVSVRSRIDTINKSFIGFEVVWLEFSDFIVVGKCDEVFKRSCQLADQILSNLLCPNFEGFNRTTCHWATAVQTLNQHFALVANYTRLAVILFEQIVVLSLGQVHLQLHERTAWIDWEVFANYAFVLVLFDHCLCCFFNL